MAQPLSPLGMSDSKRSILLKKKELRARMKKALLALTEEKRREYSERICQHLVASPLWTAYPSIAMFAGDRTEPDLLPLLDRTDAPALFFPKVRAEHILEWYRITDQSQFEPGAYGLLEPKVGLEAGTYDPEQVLLLIPGRAFSSTGDRLGRGGGYYDRLLARVGDPSRMVGIGFSFQLHDLVPSEPHDEPVGSFLCESGHLEVVSDPS